MVKRIEKNQMFEMDSIQLTHNWDLEILKSPKVPGILSEGVIRGTARSVTVPKITKETAEFNKQGIKWEEIVNINTAGDWSFVCYELETSNLRKFMAVYDTALKQKTLSRKDMCFDFKISSKTRTDKTNLIYIVKNFFIMDLEIPEFNSDAGFMEITVNGKFSDLDIRSV